MPTTQRGNVTARDYTGSELISQLHMALPNLEFQQAKVLNNLSKRAAGGIDSSLRGNSQLGAGRNLGRRFCKHSVQEARQLEEKVDTWGGAAEHSAAAEAAEGKQRGQKSERGGR